MRETILLTLFDLPVKTRSQRREYSRFRNALKKQGFQLLQKSIYYKYISNVSNRSGEEKQIRQFAPQTGSILFLPVPLASFTKIRSLLGPPFDLARLISPVIEV